MEDAGCNGRFNNMAQETASKTDLIENIKDQGSVEIHDSLMSSLEDL